MAVKKPRFRIYEVHVPVKKTEIYEVYACSRSDAIERVFKGDKHSEYVLEQDGWPKAGSTGYTSSSPVARMLKGRKDYKEIKEKIKNEQRRKNIEN